MFFGFFQFRKEKKTNSCYKPQTDNAWSKNLNRVSTFRMLQHSSSAHACAVTVKTITKSYQLPEISILLLIFSLSPLLRYFFYLQFFVIITVVVLNVTSEDVIFVMFFFSSE